MRKAAQMTPVPTPRLERHPEDITIEAVMDAAEAAFAYRGERGVSKIEVVNACAAVLAFLKAAERLPPRSFKEWREAIEALHIRVGLDP